MAKVRIGHFVEAEIRQYPVENTTVQDIEDDPLTTLHDLGHRRLVASAPGSREIGAINFGMSGLDFSLHRAVPVDHGSKYVEGNYLDLL